MKRINAGVFQVSSCSMYFPSNHEWNLLKFSPACQLLAVVDTPFPFVELAPAAAEHRGCFLQQVSIPSHTVRTSMKISRTTWRQRGFNTGHRDQRFEPAFFLSGFKSGSWLRRRNQISMLKHMVLCTGSTYLFQSIQYVVIVIRVLHAQKKKSLHGFERVPWLQTELPIAQT
jgi:hypothetical protein